MNLVKIESHKNIPNIQKKRQPMIDFKLRLYNQNCFGYL